MLSWVSQVVRYPAAFLRDRSYRAVNLVGLGSLVYVVVERVVLADVSPLFPRAGEAGSIVSDIAIGYVAAWILLYLVTWRPAYVQRHRAAVVVARQIFAMAARASQMRGILRNAANSQETGPLTRHELHELCLNVTLRRASSMTQVGNPTNHVSVLAALNQLLRDGLSAAPRIVELMPYFDSDFVLRVAALQTSDLVAFIDPLVPIEAAVSPALTLEFLEGPLLNHFSECNELWAWMCTNYPAESAQVGPNVLKERLEVPQFDFGY